MSVQGTGILSLMPQWIHLERKQYLNVKQFRNLKLLWQILTWYISEYEEAMVGLEKIYDHMTDGIALRLKHSGMKKAKKHLSTF